MRLASRGRLQTLGLVAILLWPAAASAQSAEDRETARRLFNEGKSRRDSGDAAGALESYRAADALMKVPTTKLAVARAYLALGRLVEARDFALMVAQIPVGPSEPQPFSDARASAARLEAELVERIPSLTIRIEGDPPEAVSVDGSVIPRDAWSAARRVNPGKHAVVASRAGRDVREEIDLAEHESKSITLDVRSLPVASVPARPNDAPVDQGATRPLGALFWVGAGVSALGVGAGTLAGVLSISSKSDADALCRDGKCPPPAHGAADDARSWATVSTIGFAAAGVGVALAAVGLALRPSNAKPSTAMIVLDRSGAGIAGSF